MEQETNAFGEVVAATDQELIAGLKRLVRADRTIGARLLVHMAEVDARGLYREHAYSSMFAYCVEELRMSEAQAYLRIHAARLGRHFPRVLQLFAKGGLNLTAIKLLGPHLTQGNHVELLERAQNKNKREIELLVASLAPKPDVPNLMRKLPETNQARVVTPAVVARPAPMPAPASPPMAAAGAPAGPPPMAASAVPAGRAPFALAAPRPAASSKPLRPGRYALQLTMGQALHSKLEQLQNLLRHQVPDGDLATLVERAVDSLIDQTLKQRFAQSKAPRKVATVQARARRRKLNSRYIPRAVLREVHQRDGGRCTFVSAADKRCGERGFLELHHSVAFVRGGGATADNLKLVCRAHNQLFAERDFGADWMRTKRLHARAQP